MNPQPTHLPDLPPVQLIAYLTSAEKQAQANAAFYAEQRAILSRTIVSQSTEQGKAAAESIISKAEASELLGLCGHTLDRYVRNGLLIKYNMGQRKVGYKLADLQRLLAPKPELAISGLRITPRRKARG